MIYWFDYLIIWSIDWLIDLLMVGLIDGLIDRLIDWLIDRSFVRLIDWLIDWLIDLSLLLQFFIFFSLYGTPKIELFISFVLDKKTYFQRFCFFDFCTLFCHLHGFLPESLVFFVGFESADLFSDIIAAASLHPSHEQRQHGIAAASTPQHQLGRDLPVRNPGRTGRGTGEESGADGRRQCGFYGGGCHDHSRGAQSGKHQGNHTRGRWKVSIGSGFDRTSPQKRIYCSIEYFSFLFLGKLHPRASKVFVNGAWIGVHRNPDELVRVLRDGRRNGTLGCEVGVTVLDGTMWTLFIFLFVFGESVAQVHHSGKEGWRCTTPAKRGGGWSLRQRGVEGWPLRKKRVEGWPLRQRGVEGWPLRQKGVEGDHSDKEGWRGDHSGKKEWRGDHSGKKGWRGDHSTPPPHSWRDGLSWRGPIVSRSGRCTFFTTPLQN